MNAFRSPFAAALAFGLLFAAARPARAQAVPSAEDRLAAALESVMTDEAVDGVAACASPAYSGWTARSQPGAMYFECLSSPDARTGVPKAFLRTDDVQRALAAHGLSYYVDYSIYDPAAMTRLDRAAVDRAAARAIRHQKAERAMRGAPALTD